MKKIVLVLLFSILVSGGLVTPVVAQEGGGEESPAPVEEVIIENGGNVPSTVAPKGNIYSTEPSNVTFKWNPVSGANWYQLQVYQGSNKVWDKVYSSSYCSTTYCQVKPTYTYGYIPYQWRVRSKVSNQWYGYSPYQGYTMRNPVPKTVWPSGYITYNKPTFKWGHIPGATQYRMQIYNGTTKAWDKVYTSSYCSGGYCQLSPTYTHSYDGPYGYRWRVGAYIYGKWYPYSGYRSYTVYRPGFNSYFNSNYTGWTVRSGAPWSIMSGGFLYTQGLANRYSSISYRYPYRNFTYTARMYYNTMGDYQAGMFVRGTLSKVDGQNMWYNTYWFAHIGNTQKYGVWKIVNGTWYPLKNWTTSSYINQNTFNTVSVYAQGSSFSYYLNGNRVWSGSDSTFSSGYVGLGSWRGEGSGQSWYDWAMLTPSGGSSEGEEGE